MKLEVVASRARKGRRNIGGSVEDCHCCLRAALLILRDNIGGICDVARRLLICG